MTKRIGFGLLVCSLLLSTSLAFAQGSARGVAEDFLDRWAAKDYSGMYNLIYTHNVVGQPEFPEAVFTQRYETTDNVLNIDSLSYTITGAEQQGQSAEITYDITMQSETYGEIVDADRLMRLVRFNGVWEVAWSTHDIFAGLTNDGQIAVAAQPSVRATIYDREGRVLASDNGTTVGMYSALARMSSQDACADLLSEILREPISTIQSRFQGYAPETIFFLAEMPAETFQQNRNALGTACGVNDGVSSLPHRTYFGGNALVHITGYVSPVTPEEEARYGTGQLVGRGGIESYYNDMLAGEQDRIVRITGPNGTVLRELANAPGSDPAPVQLTIDRDIQLSVANALGDAYNYAVTNWGRADVSVGGSAVVLDARNGDVLAMYSYPSFNPSLFNPNGVTDNRPAAISDVINDPRRPQINRATAELLSPGSVFKIMTMTAVLNENIIGLNDRFNCELFWDGRQYGDTREQRQDWRVVDDMQAAGVITPAEALMASCNPFFWEHGALLYRDVGASAINDYSERLGMLDTYFSGRIQEAQAQIPIPNFPEEAINEAIGQGDVAIAPIHLATAVVGIANGGTVYKPRIVQQVGGLDGTEVVETVEPQVLNELDFAEGVLETIQQGMCGVTTVEGLGTAYGRFVGWDTMPDSEYAYVDLTAPYTVCGKTGTSQTLRYPNAWFVAYAPADDPEIVVVVAVDQSLEGSQVAAPIARRIFDDYFNVSRASFPEWWNTFPYDPLDTPDGGVGTGAQSGEAP